MATPRAILCGGAAGDGLPFADAKPLALDAPSAAGNVRLSLDDLRAAGRAVPPEFLDLLDIAAYVYVADQVVTRGKAGVDNAGANWRRQLFFRVPVRVPDLWSSEAVSGALASVLGFLSDDVYQFEFVPRRGPPGGAQQYFQFGDGGAGSDVDGVVMFSGGLDSLGGAVRELVTERRRALLVGHRSNPKDNRRHAGLLDRLGHYAGRRPAVAAVQANKPKGMNREYTQRSRSFLYAALGATTAALIGQDRFRFYENGVVSLNLPALDQVVGARATRTTHPQTLAGFSKLFTAIAGKPFAVENPFQWRTKTEIVRQIVDAGCPDLIGLSTSCAHTWERTNAHTHCGRCSQCIDRRFAVLAAGAARHDPDDAYAVDLLTGERPPDQVRVFALAYVGLARRLRSLDQTGFLAEFGVATRALRYCGVPTGEASRLMYDLLVRHGRQVMGALSAGIAAHSEALTNRELPQTCLMQLVIDSGTADPAGGADPGRPTPPAEPPLIPLAGDAPNVFRLQGQAWIVRFQGGKEFVLLPSKGAIYLRELLACPERPVSAVELAYRADHRSRRVAVSRGDAVLDPQAFESYYMRLSELSEDVNQAEADGDSARAESSRKEFETISAQLTGSTALGGSARRANDDLAKFRGKVGNAARRTLKDIAIYCPELREHLDACLRIGTQSSYTPPESVRWVTD